MGRGQTKRAAGDGDVPVGGESRRGFGLEVGRVPCAVTGSGSRDGSASDIHISRRLDAFGGCCRDGGIDGTAGDIDISCIFVLMAGGDAGRGGASEVALDAVIADAGEGDSAALDLHVLLAVDTVSHGGGDIEGEVFDSDIGGGLDSMLGVSGDVECAVTLNLQLSFAVDAGFVGTVGGVGERVDGAFLRGELDTFGIGDIDSRSVGVGEGHAGEGDGGFIRTVKSERTVGGVAGERIRDFRSQVAALADRHMCPADGERDIPRYITGNGNPR